jgi:ubiquitin-like-conjugating enzyme ATG3
MFEDIIQDYAHRTVTIESHPHLDAPHASIHPCQVGTQGGILVGARGVGLR